MKWFEFECKECNMILNAKKYKVYTETRDVFCSNCCMKICIDCQRVIFVNPTYIGKCKKCKIKENKRLRLDFPSINCVYFLFSKKLNLFKIGETNSVTTRLSKIKYEYYPCDDWKIIEIYPFIKKKLLQNILHFRFSDYHYGGIDYFKDLHFLLENGKFIDECIVCENFLKNKSQ